MQGTVIYKMSGSGNDFVFVDGRWAPAGQWTPERVRRVCARRTGVGADGLVILSPGSRRGAVRFQFYNSDGSGGAMCGNAALCAARLAAWLELAPPEGLTLETDAGEVRARCLPGEGERAELELPPPAELRRPGIEPAAGERSIHYTTVGVPHVVVRVDDLAAVPLLERGRALRSHPALGPEGANVNFLSNGAAGWAMRTYERGVEGETLACGTGAVACAAVLVAEGAVNLPLDIVTTSGSILTVSAGSPGSPGLPVPQLAGEGRLVFRAVLGR